MAKAARIISKGDAKDWFTGLTFETQQSVLDEFAKVHDLSKEQRINALERELTALRSHTVSVSKPSSRRKPPSQKGVKVKPKYRHPETGETWAGRGVHPRWMREYLKKRGNKLEDLLIKN